MPDDLQTVVAKAIVYPIPNPYMPDFHPWDNMDRVDQEVALIQANAAITAALSWLAAEAGPSPVIVCNGPGPFQSLAGYLRSHIPPGQEGDDGDG